MIEVLPPYLRQVPVIFPHLRPVNTDVRCYVYRDDETGGEGVDYWPVDIDEDNSFDESPFRPWVPGEPETHED